MSHIRTKTKNFFLEKLFIEQHYEHLTIVKNSFTEHLANVTIELHFDSKLYAETDPKQHIDGLNDSDATVWSTTTSRALIISLTIVGCILSFSLGLLIRYNLVKRKMISNKLNKTKRMIFVVENNAKCLKQAITEQNEKYADNTIDR